MTLDHLPRGSTATITDVAWDEIPHEDGQRLRALGLDKGAEISIAHRGVLGGKDPLAVSIGRMTVALRRAHAAAMTVAEQ